jgi:hypothetical protein
VTVHVVEAGPSDPSMDSAEFSRTDRNRMTSLAVLLVVSTNLVRGR